MWRSKPPKPIPQSLSVSVQPSGLRAAVESVGRNAAATTKGMGDGGGVQWTSETVSGCIWKAIHQESGAKSTEPKRRWFHGHGTDQSIPEGLRIRLFGCRCTCRGKQCPSIVMGVDGLAAHMAWLPAENQKCSKTRSSVISWYSMQFRSLTSASQTTSCHLEPCGI